MMFDTRGQWLPLETYEEFDNGLSDLIELWSDLHGAASQELKARALAHFKQDLEAATLNWAENRAKSRKYASIAQELAEFEAVLAQA